MSARDDFPLVLDVALSQYNPDKAREAGRCLDEIDRLRAEIARLTGAPSGQLEMQL